MQYLVSWKTRKSGDENWEEPVRMTELDHAIHLGYAQARGLPFKVIEYTQEEHQLHPSKWYMPLHMIALCILEIYKKEINIDTTTFYQLTHRFKTGTGVSIKILDDLLYNAGFTVELRPIK